MLKNNGDGTFAAKIDYATGDGPGSVITADVDGDGDADLLVANYTSDTVSVLKNNGDGTFAAKIHYATWDSPRSAITADVDADGDVDMIVVNQKSHNVLVFKNSGNGTFAAERVYGTLAHPESVIAADVDGDGDADMVVAYFNKDEISVFLNTGNGTYTTKVNYSVGSDTGSNPRSVISTDIDGDVDADVIVANGTSDTVTVLLNKGDGTFAAKIDYAAGDRPVSVTSVDIDGDGDADLLVANYSSDTVSVLKNNGDGTFAAKIDYATGDGPGSVITADVDGDVDADMLMLNSSDMLSVLLNTSIPEVSVALEQTGVLLSPSIVIRDPDGDASWNGGSLRVQVVAHAEAADSLFLPTVNPGGGGIWLDPSGNSVMAGATQIGSADAVSVTNGSVWTLTFNENATNALVQEVARAMKFMNGSDTPGTDERAVRFTVTDKDGGTANVDQKVMVDAVNDAPSGSVWTTGTAKQYEVLTAHNNLADADGLGAISYQWYAGDTAISGVTDAVFTVTQAQVGQRMKVEARYTDGQGTVEHQFSTLTGAVANVNDAPTGTVRITGEAMEDGVLTVAHNLADVDGIGSGVIEYQWYADGELFRASGENECRLSVDQVDKSITVRATWIDGQGTREIVLGENTVGPVLKVNHAPECVDCGSSGTPVYRENGAAVVMAAGIVIVDEELARAGNYGGMSLKVMRHDGPSAQDLFSVKDSGTLEALAEHGDLVVEGVHIGTVESNSSGLLELSFNANATQARLDAVLQQLTYRNGSDAAPASVELDWTFSDGNTDGSQGEGGVESSTFTIAVSITQINDLPTGSVTLSGTAREGETLHVSNDLADADNLGAISYQWYADGSAIDGATGDSYLLTQKEVGKVLKVAAQYTDGQGTVERSESAPTSPVADNPHAPVFTSGASGWATTDFGGADTGWDVALQPDGKIVVVGNGGSAGGFAIARYNSDGTLDAGFSHDGKLVSHTGWNAQSVALQADGKIVVAGYAVQDFAVARYHADGSVDTSFSEDGRQTTDFGGEDYAYDVALQADGRIVVAGRSVHDFAIARYNADGSIDRSFSMDGRQTSDFGSYDYGRSITMQRDGKIIVAGDKNASFALARYTVEGALDTSFSVDGMASTTITGSTYGQSVLVQPDGLILVAGYNTSTSRPGLVLERYTPAGELDTTFGTGGIVGTDFPGADRGFDVALQPDGKIVVAGYTGDGNIAVARYNSLGVLDAEFGIGGMVNVDPGGDDKGYGIVAQPDGKIVIAGTSDGDFAVVRLNTDGTIDHDFGQQEFGLGSHVAYVENADPVVLEVGGGVYDADMADLGHYGGATLTLSRKSGADRHDEFSAISTGNMSALIEGSALKIGGIDIGTVTTNSSGTLSLTFNSNTTQQLIDAAIRQIAYSNSSDNPPSVVRIGWFFDDTTGLKTELTTTIEIAVTNDAPSGSVSIDGTAAQHQVLHTVAELYDAEGMGDMTCQWYADGVAIAGANDANFTLTQREVGKAITVKVSYTDGSAHAESMVSEATGKVTEVNDAPRFLDAKVHTDFLGYQDTASGALLQRDGKIVVAGSAWNGEDYDMALLRYGSDGVLDTDFAADGKAVKGLLAGSSDHASAVATQADGKIVVAGSVRHGGETDIALLRYNPDGSVDTGFGIDGMTVTNIGQHIGSSSDDGAYSIAIQPDGKILVGVTCTCDDDSDAVVVRYNENGTIDTLFGVDGVAVMDYGQHDSVKALAVQDNGGIFVVGSVQPSSAQNNAEGLLENYAELDMGLIRLDSDGSVDTSFGFSGLATVDISGKQDSATSVSLQDDGKIVIAGSAFNGTNHDIAVICMNPDGSLDQDFSGDGKTIISLSEGMNEAAASVVIQGDGKILVAGSAFNGHDDDFVLVRYNSDGSLDKTFSDDGFLTTQFLAGSEDQACSVLVQEDGKIVVTGTIMSDGGADFAAVRYNADGSLDASFGIDSGTVTYVRNEGAVILDGEVELYDADLAASGNYGGTVLTLSRHGGSSTADHFSAAEGGTLSALQEGHDLLVSGKSIGKVLANSAGILSVCFNANAGQGDVNAVIRQIAYSNDTEATSSSVRIDWLFSDGNIGLQGPGGALTAKSVTTVEIVKVNHRPEGGLMIGGSPLVGQELNVIDALSDIDGMGEVSYRWKADGRIIAGATGTTLHLDDTFVGKQISVDALYADLGGANELVSSAPTDPVALPDTTAPEVVYFRPGNGNSGVSIHTSIRLDFSEAVQPGIGTIAIYQGAPNGILVETIDVGTSTAVSIFNNSLTVDPSAGFQYGTDYYVTVSDGAILDMAGNHFAGTSSYHFQTVADATSGQTLTGRVSFWNSREIAETGLDGVTITLKSVSDSPAADLLDFRNFELHPEGSSSVELWADSPRTNVMSIQLDMTLNEEKPVSWESDDTLPFGWFDVANTETPGKFVYAAMGITPATTFPVRLGTLEVSADTETNGISLVLVSGSIGSDTLPETTMILGATSSSGEYALSGAPSGVYAMTAEKDASSIGGAVTVDDALAALKLAVGLNPNADGRAVSPYQYIAADVNRNGKLTVDDALDILKMAVHLGSARNAEWLFVSPSVENRTVNCGNVPSDDALSSVEVDQNLELDLIGVVRGDVNGSWVAEAV